MTAGTDSISLNTSEPTIDRPRQLADSLSAFLLLPRGYTNWIWRLLGICAIVDGVQIHDWMKFEAIPYIVPAWRLGSHLLFLPVIPHSLIDPLFTIFFIAAALMALGLRSKWVLCIPILTLTYFCALELMVASLHFTILLDGFLIALLFDRPGLSLTRRLIQLHIAFCYGYSTLQKIFVLPFMQGYSLKAHASDGWFMKPFWFNLAQEAHLSDQFYYGLAIAVILTEGFLCFSLFPKGTRKLGIFVGIVFHGIMATLMHWWIGVFTIVTWSSYFAFLEPKNETPVEPEKKREFLLNHKPSLYAAVALIAFWFLMPLRIYYWPERPADTITLLDRRPWTYAMFVTADETKALKISITDASGAQHKIAATGRMWMTQSDNDMYTLCRYIMRKNPLARSAELELIVLSNKMTQIKKQLTATRHGRSIAFQPLKVAASPAGAGQ